MAMDRYWRIFTPEKAGDAAEYENRHWDQRARKLEIQGGALVFTDGSGKLLVAVSPTAWSTVEEIVEADAGVQG
jgi:hypothetical protein